ncbi:DUF308 domain-containing protein [Mycolicibacterium monacense]|uniref:Membrane protein n=1 Tax=Mycolicibacterium monacense TaxID=85693 RepID=A0AAD1N100_MYCMB|nr:DUF308 domain-containing protein [Mycolicibacterium monacense]MDA4101858.1 membrane protein [Mycolicibacterium monacense DSM 44395]ORB12217.1 hypothetical protein BST34_27370 [Mycolicibacterium monacense DSM 44395]QHP84798.1 DUF308 domain-containing protein [Mycolicibacterium monacense DSM 44395]BBZ62391.1 membrane protein [Mycolicibacterium monacense]
MPLITATDTWLRSYYALRGAVSLLWVAAAVTIGPRSAAVAGVLLLIYPAWDALANLADARQNGGLRRNPTQAFNAAVSVLTTVAVAVALVASLNAVLGVFGVWAALSGLLQLATAVRRWKTVGAQWLMVVSGAQSAAAGAMFLVKAGAPETPSVADIAPYAAFGAFYFLMSALWLAVSAARRHRAT